MPEKGILESAKEKLGTMLSSAFASNASPSSTAVPDPDGPGCKALAVKIENNGGSVLAGDQKRALACGLGGT